MFLTNNTGIFKVSKHALTLAKVLIVMRPQHRTNEEILKIARDVFTKNGPQSSVEDIAKLVGISQPALFKRFGTKQNLLIEALKVPTHLPWENKALSDIDNRSFVEQYTELVLEVRTWFAKLQPLLSAIKFSGIPTKDIMKDHTEPIPVRSARLVSDWLKRCNDKNLIRDMDYKIAAKSTLGYINSEITVSGLMKVEKSEQEICTEIKSLVEFLWQGMKPKE